MSIEYRAALPDRDTLFNLFLTTGWNAGFRLTADELHRAAGASWFAVSAWDDGRLVGFGRILSDGIMHALIVDMIVHPDWQRRGIGSEVMRCLLGRCQEAGVRDVQLFCARGKAAFYKCFGFKERPDDAPGMGLPSR